MKTTLIISLALFLLPMVYLAKHAGSDFLAVDSCLDSGGSYDYNKNACGKKENHTYISYGKRKTTLILLCSSVSFAGLVVFIATKKKNNKLNDQNTV